MSEIENQNETDKSPETEPSIQSSAKHEGHKNTDGSRLNRFKRWYGERKKWTIPASALLFILLLCVIPFTRYTIAGLVVKKDFSVSVTDATAGTPVSGATVSVGSISAETDGTGKATLHKIKPGSHTLIFTKKYYEDGKNNLTVPILAQKQVPDKKMKATGRQVKVTVTDVINKKVLSDVDITVADVSAKTDKDGSAIIVLPAGLNEQQAKLSLEGYNDSEVTIKVSNDKIQDNNVTLTPSGKVYFLSKLSGKVDVVKTNLDGSSRQTVLPGTGKEDDRNTVLLASRDWKYLALLSRRAGSSPTLYLIDTSNDSLTTIDEGSAEFTLAGWIDDDFVYTVTRSNVQLWQSNRQAVKSFNAPSKKLTTLDQTTASGSGNFDYLTELIGDVYAYSDQVFYIKNWTSSYTGSSSDQIANKQATFNSIKPDGSAKKAIKSFGLASGTTGIDVTLESRAESPTSIDLKFSDGTKDNFYVYANGQVKTESSGTVQGFYSADYPTYLLSPSSRKTFWSESRDGKNTLFVGDSTGQDGKQIANLSEYNTYGWFTDKYLLVSKNSSELYIMPDTGSKTPLKISDYHKPSLTFDGYGGGYGGF